MRNVYLETYRGVETVRTEAPLVTYHWLNRRVELSSRARDRACQAWEEARRAGERPRQSADLKLAYEDANDAHAHAVAMQAAFAKRFKPGEGYLDPEDWERNAPPPPPKPNVTDTAVVLGDDGDDDEEDAAAGNGIDEPPAGPRNLGGEVVPPRHDEPPRRVKPSKPIAQPSASPAPIAMPPQPPIATASSSPIEPPPPSSRPPATEDSAPPADEPVSTPPGKRPKSAAYEAQKFKKGMRSPNPEGRPKGAKNLSTSVKEVLGQSVPAIGADGRRRKVPAANAILMKLLHRALGEKLDLKAIELVLKLLATHWNEIVREKVADISAEDRALLTNRLQLLNFLDPDEGKST